MSIVQIKLLMNDTYELSYEVMTHATNQLRLFRGAIDHRSELSYVPTGLKRSKESKIYSSSKITHLNHIRAAS